MTIFICLILLVMATTIAAFIFSTVNQLLLLIIFFVECVAVVIPFILFSRQASIYLQERCFELEAKHPGIYKAFEEWEQRRSAANS